jgi:hypothetical protein
MYTRSLPLPPVEKLREVFSYNPETGVITRNKVINRWKSKGGVVDNLDPEGYIRVWCQGRLLTAGRVAYTLHYGIDPYPLEIDHINRIRNDNRICNLRAVTQDQNNDNRDPATVGRPRGSCKPLRVEYPDGGTITFKSIQLVAFTLNETVAYLRGAIARHGGRLYNNRVDTGIRVSYN